MDPRNTSISFTFAIRITTVYYEEKLTHVTFGLSIRWIFFTHTLQSTIIIRLLATFYCTDPNHIQYIYIHHYYAYTINTPPESFLTISKLKEGSLQS